MNEKTIFLAALELSDPLERSAYLNKACAGDTVLLQKVQSLLASHEKSGDFLEWPALRQMAADSGAIQAQAPTPRDEIDLSYLGPSTTPDSLGTLGHYEILQILGRGGFGTVLKAFDEKLHRFVAIKVLSRELAATSPPRKRFLREARAMAAIKNENVIAIHSVEEQPLPYFVMEFVDGATLQDRMDEAGPIPVAEILHIGKQIASGLAAAHALGLIHRDIKPANILLEKGMVQKVKISDFGLARAADDASMTQSGMIAGTPLYMAPEQARGGSLDARTDLFSLGSVLYALATGHPPFRASSAMAVLRRVAEETPRPIQEVISDIPDWLVFIIKKLLAKQSEDRFQSAQELAEVLAKCQSELQAGVPVTAVNKLATAQPAPSTAPKRTEPSKKKIPLAGIAAGALMMFAIMSAGLFLWSQNRNSSPAIFASAPGYFRSSSTTPATLPAMITAPDGNTAPVMVNPKQPLAVTLTNSIGMEFVKVPKGTAWLGGGAGQPGTTKMEIEEDFYLGKYEVTQGEWEAVTGLTPSYFSRTGGGAEVVKDISDADLKRFPVETVSWEDCQLFIERLNQREKDSGRVYRLPKEAEWEYACRGGPVSHVESAFDFYFSIPKRTLFPNEANFSSPQSLKRTTKVGSYEPNILGLHDMHGNVWEWCEDEFKAHEQEGSRRVYRGGGWCFEASQCRSAKRLEGNSLSRSDFNGFRIVLSSPTGIPK